MNRFKKLWTVLLPALVLALVGCVGSQRERTSYQPPPRVIYRDQTPAVGMMEAPARSQVWMPQPTAPSVQPTPQTCPTCGGTGFIVCYTCKGKGWVRCEHCGGTGKDPTGGQCMVCRGSGVHGCTTCGIILGTSSGRLQCPRCKGRGTIGP
jgi:hypothetical protein